MDGDDEFHISYYDATHDELKYAYRVGTTLVISWVDSDGDVGRYSSLALDGSDNPHISYYNSSSDDLKYAYRPDDTWINATIDSSGDVGQYTSLALDGDGNPHISYYDNTNGALKYAWWTDSSWISETVDTEGDVGKYSSLALDGSDPRISYHDSYPCYDLKYAYLRRDPTVDFSAAAYSVSESVGTATITVTLDAASAETATVDYTTSDGTARAASDYTSVNGTLTFDAGVTSQAFTVPISQDALDEHDETVILMLSNASGAILGSNTPATLTIEDDDAPPTVDFSSATYNVGEDAGLAPIAITLDAASGLTVTVSYSTADGTATAGVDYTAGSGMLTFTPGVTSRNFNVMIMSDEIKEDKETVMLTLFDAENAVIGDHSPAMLTIIEEVRVYLPLAVRQSP